MKELLSKYDLNYDEVCQGKSEIEWKVELFIGVMKIIKFNKRYIIEDVSKRYVLIF